MEEMTLNREIDKKIELITMGLMIACALISTLFLLGDVGSLIARSLVLYTTISIPLVSGFVRSRLEYKNLKTYNVRILYDSSRKYRVLSLSILLIVQIVIWIMFLVDQLDYSELLIFISLALAYKIKYNPIYTNDKGLVINGDYIQFDHVRAIEKDDQFCNILVTTDSQEFPISLYFEKSYNVLLNHLIDNTNEEFHK